MPRQNAMPIAGQIHSRKYCRKCIRRRRDFADHFFPWNAGYDKYTFSKDPKIARRVPKRPVIILQDKHDGLVARLKPVGAKTPISVCVQTAR